MVPWLHIIRASPTEETMAGTFEVASASVGMIPVQYPIKKTEARIRTDETIPFVLVATTSPSPSEIPYTARIKSGVQIDISTYLLICVLSFLFPL
jgi:hypothetical protein